jgi:hypothetical protein
MGFGNEKCKEIVENICPYCGEVLMMNKRSFANHVRWCKKNPRYAEIKESCISKLKSKPSKQKTYICQCEVCGKEYEVQCTEHKHKLGKYRKTCCDKCSKQLTTLKTNNEIKIEKLKSHYISNILIKKCEYCGEKYSTKKQTQKFCSIECATKHRSLKYYNNLSDRKLKHLYDYNCRFQFALNSYPNEFDFSLIEKYGWYKAKNRGNNLNGISRDHIYSRDKGFENLIDPYIISHPANCQLLRHNDNASKHSDCDIELESLIEKIQKWNQKYGEYPNTIDYKLFESLGINFQKFEMMVKE